MTDRTVEGALRLQKVADREWAAARHHAALLLRRGSLPRLEAHNLPLAPGELAVLRTVVTVAAPGGWGEEHAAAVVATTERLVVSHRLRGWQSFWFSDLKSFEPELSSSNGWALAVQWHGGDALRLSGLGVPVLAVHVAALALPGRWMDLPSLRALVEGLEREDQVGPVLPPAGADPIPDDPISDPADWADPARLLKAVAAGMNALVDSPGRGDWVQDLRNHPDAEVVLGVPATARDLIATTGRLAGETISAHWGDLATSPRASRGARIEMFLPHVPAIRPRVQEAARAVFNRGVTVPGAQSAHPELDGLRADELWDVWCGVLWWFEITVRRLPALRG